MYTLLVQSYMSCILCKFPQTSLLALVCTSLTKKREEKLHAHYVYFIEDNQIRELS